MSGVLEKRSDGSVALFIDGDLQFDSRDERVYHESLTLPALALMLSRNRLSGLRVLIVGGGDGLCARELFKSNQITSVDLVDYDPQIIELGRRELSTLNANSLSHRSLTVHVRDAWQYVEEAVSRGDLFDLVICDLTVPQDMNGVRFHTVDWYERLFQIIGRKGVLAVNGCSPQATPRAYCSILNSMVKAKLHTHPYRICVPSFMERGYGADWGFFLASPARIEPEEFGASFEALSPRYCLEDLAALKELFLFPENAFDHQAAVWPARLGSGILLQYFLNDRELSPGGSAQLDALRLDTSAVTLLEPDCGQAVVPAIIGSTLVRALQLDAEGATSQAVDVQTILNGVIDLMPELARESTAQLIDSFLKNPRSFLQGLDLRGLVSTLLARAAELPSRLVAELEGLRQRLDDWTDDNVAVLSVGQRVLILLTLVIVLGNLLYPDMVYAKGHAAEGAHGHAGGHAAGNAAGHAGEGARAHSAEGHHAAEHRAGFARRGGLGGWNGGTWVTPVYPRKRVEVAPSSAPLTKPVPAAPQIKNYSQIKGYKRLERYLSGDIARPASCKLNTQLDQSNPGQIAASNQTDLTRRHKRLAATKEELCGYADLLRRELADLESSSEPMTIFGTRSISRLEAISRTGLAIARTQADIDRLNEQLEQVRISINFAASDEQGRS